MEVRRASAIRGLLLALVAASLVGLSSGSRSLAAGHATRPWVWTKAQAEYLVGGKIGLTTACAPLGSPYRQGGLNYYYRFYCVVAFNDGSQWGLVIKPTGKASYARLSVRMLRGPTPAAVGLYAGVGGGHWITFKSLDNSVVKLEDGSRWLLSPVDRYNAVVWLVVDDVTVTDTDSVDPLYPYTLTDTTDGSTVDAKFLGY